LDLIKIFEGHQADVVFIQEPTHSLIEAGKSNDHKVPVSKRSCNKEWKAWTHPGGAQGTIVILTSDNATVTGTLEGVEPSPGQGSPPLVCGTVKKDKEMVKFATCHTPYGENDGRAITYNQKAMDKVNAKNIQLWMGDLNTYGNTLPDGGTRSRPTNNADNYRLALAAPTSKAGHPLDKIIVDGSLPIESCGRIVPGDANKPRTPSPSGDRFVDETERNWKSANDVPSDHLPTYAIAGSARAEDPTKGSQSTKRALDYDSVMNEARKCQKTEMQTQSSDGGGSGDGGGSSGDGGGSSGAGGD
jgi:uncharacterized membrane protein YgcG